MAIILANLLAAKFGPTMTVINSFVFIGLDLSSRDQLHELWHNRGFTYKMGSLILAGSCLSWLLNQNARAIAIASFIAFLVTAIVDTLVYMILYKKHYLIKVNGSNLISGLADSIIFPTLAFGTFIPFVVLGQFLCKLFGGAVWSIILKKGNHETQNK